jgi:site-specific recombinase XerD
MDALSDAHFKRNYQLHLQHLKLKGLQPRTIKAYSHAIRRIGAHFDYQMDDLSEQQLLDYFTDLVASHSWSSVKLDLYGLKFYYAHVLRKPWVAPGLIKPPRTQRLPDIVTIKEARRALAAMKQCRTQASPMMQPMPAMRASETGAAFLRASPLSALSAP